MSAELRLVDDWYELTRHLAERVERFPRGQRHGVGAEVNARCLAVLADLVRAKFAPAGPQKADTLRRANVELEVIRFLLRLAHDLKALPHDAHRHALERLQECGRQLGGWVKAVTTRGGS